jgi:hypothetical protein
MRVTQGNTAGRRALRATTTALGALALTLSLAGTASAAVFTPTTFVDEEVNIDDCPADVVETDGETDCSLREAVDAANANEADDEVVLSAGRYALNPSMGTIRIRRFTSDENFSTGTLLIRGAGARLSTVDGNGAIDAETRVFTFQSGSTAELRDLAVTGGFVTGSSNGGAIKVQDGPDANATMTRVWLFDNHAQRDGGAISNRGKLRLVQSLVSGNTANGSGGGIENDDELWLENTTISGNRALGTPSEAKPGLSTQSDDFLGNGGGIDNDGDDRERILSGELGTLTNEEVVVESAGVFAENSTIAGNEAAANGGGISTAIDETSTQTAAPEGQARAHAIFHNSIVSDNTAPAEANCSGNYPPESGPASSSQGHNIEDGETCEFKATGDKDDTPKLGPLADNGGGTDTHALLDGSPAIDAADADGCPAVDQRGITRPQRTACDIGAFELEPPAPPKQEEQPPAQQPEPLSQQPITPQGDACRDRTDPTTTLRISGLKIGSSGVTLKGRSSDSGDCPSGVQRVEVSMAQVSGTGLNCRFIRRTNLFVITPFRNCRRPILFTAKGTTRWSFKFIGQLPRGKYRAQARAYDVARNKETPTKGRNIIYFEVK